ARSRTDAYEYAALGIPAVREMFASALDAATRVLLKMGFSEAKAQRVVERFSEYDEQQIAQNAAHRNDLSKLIALTEQGRRDIAQLLAAETRSAPQIDEGNSAGDEQRGEDESTGERLRQE